MKKAFVLLIVLGVLMLISCTHPNPKLDALEKKLDSIHKADSIEKINKERQKVADSIANVIELKLKKN